LFSNSKRERYVFKEQSRIRLSIIYIPHIPIHMHILIWLYDLTLFGSIVWLYNICAASMLFHVFSLPMNSTINLSCRKRKAYQHYCLGEDPQIPHILRDLGVLYNRSSKFYFENLQKLQNNGWAKSLRHSAWLDYSVFQLLKTQVKAKKLHG
jgi:hypothetical protein